MKKLTFILLLFSVVWTTDAQNTTSANNYSDSSGEAFVSVLTKHGSKKRINFYVISKTKKIEFFPLTVKIRAWKKSLFSKRRMRVITAENAEIAAAKIEKILKEKNAVIGSLWFDSHGYYKNGFSSFSIGTDNYNFRNINDTIQTSSLTKLARFADENTKIGIGSCYGGASFQFPGTATVKPGPMNGDSLMIGLGMIFSGATIYASQSWVMMKPGIFSNSFGMAGFPLGKKYKTAYWKPVWDHLGMWRSYNINEGYIKNVNTVSLSKVGEINCRARKYLDLTKGRNKQKRALDFLARTDQKITKEIISNVASSPHIE